MTARGTHPSATTARQTALSEIKDQLIYLERSLEGGNVEAAQSSSRALKSLIEVFIATLPPSYRIGARDDDDD